MNFVAMTIIQIVLVDCHRSRGDFHTDKEYLIRALSKFPPDLLRFGAGLTGQGWLVGVIYWCG